MKKNLTHVEVMEAAKAVAGAVSNCAFNERKGYAWGVQRPYQKLRCYPVPRGGIPAAYALGRFLDIEIVQFPGSADFIFDDLIDSGKTKEQYVKKYKKPFFALFDKRKMLCAPDGSAPWIVFPWEIGNGKDTSVEDNITRLLQFIGEDPEREGLRETPERVMKAWEHWCSGYGKNPADVLKCFQDGSEHYDQMIWQHDIPFYSMCEHHLAPFFGTATIAYIPKGRVVGLSKLSRVLDIFARRLQIQERLTQQVSHALYEALDPHGVGVLIKARHLCMESRGISKQGHLSITSSLEGVFRKAEVRAEFFSMAE